MEDTEKALWILKKDEKTYEELEWLSIYLLCLEDFRNYTKQLTQPLIISLVRLLKIEQYSRGHSVFKKGSFPDKWIIVLEGELELYYTIGGENKLMKRISKGKQIGDREILRNKAYSLTCIPTKISFLLCLSKESFLSLLGSFLDNRLLALRSFVSNYLPEILPYSWSFKEKIGYALTINEYKRGEVVINKDEIAEKLHFVYDGEAAVSVDFENKLKNIVRLVKGMCFGEECTLLGKPSFFTIRISSERALIASIDRADMFLLPDETIAALKKNLQTKVASRKSLLKIPRQKIVNATQSNSPAFKSANRQARQKLVTYILRNRPCTPKRILNISRIKNKAYKDQLEFLRDCSPSRVLIIPQNYKDFEEKKNKLNFLF